METEVNINKEDFYNEDNYDEWGAAFVWLNNVRGVEYNICMDDGENCSAIYKMEIDEETGYMETDTSTFKHYEIDFDDPNWEEKLIKRMIEVANEFFK